MHLPPGARLIDFGRLRRAGDLKVYHPGGGGDQATDYVFLLDSVMLLCNKPSLMQQRYRFRSAIRLQDWTVENGGYSPTVQNTIR